MKRKPVAYIDGDIILHRAVSFVDREFDGEPMVDVRSALRFFDHILEKWLEEAVKTEDYFLVLSVGPNFRKGLYPEYKANRKDIEPHPSFKGLKEEVMERLEAVWEENIEADDYIGIKCSEDPENTLAISADKDFATVPCRLMVPASHQRTKPDWFEFSEDQANLNWLRQSMMGDTIDNYKGIYRVGKAKASKIIPEEKPLDELWKATEAAFVASGNTPEYALTMARLARILRHGDYDWDTKEIKLWTPDNFTS